MQSEETSEIYVFKFDLRKTMSDGRSDKKARRLASGDLITV